MSNTEGPCSNPDPAVLEQWGREAGVIRGLSSGPGELDLFGCLPLT